MKKYKKVTPTTSAEIRLMYQKYNIRGKELLDHFPGVSKANVYKHAKRPIGAGEYVDKRKETKVV